MDYETYARVMQRMQQRKQKLELQNVSGTVQDDWEDDEFEASRFTHDWTCGRRSYTAEQTNRLKSAHGFGSVDSWRADWNR
jgi:hypothetical protein